MSDRGYLNAYEKAIWFAYLIGRVDALEGRSRGVSELEIAVRDEASSVAALETENERVARQVALRWASA